MSVTPSFGLQVLCGLITAVLVVAFVLGRGYAGRRSGEAAEDTRAGSKRAALGIGLWLTLTGALAGAGLLADFESFPPRIMPMLGLGFVLTAVVAFSSFGKRLALGLPLWLLVGYQGFRVAVEIMLHRAYADRGLKVVAVNADAPGPERRALVDAYLQARPQPMPVALDDGSARRALRVQVFPHLVLVDRQGTIRHMHQGRVLASTLRGEIEGLLGEGAAAAPISR